MFSKKLLVSTALLFAGATALVAAQNDRAVKTTGIMVWEQKRENDDGDRACPVAHDNERQGFRA